MFNILNAFQIEHFECKRSNVHFFDLYIEIILKTGNYDLTSVDRHVCLKSAYERFMLK